MTNHNPHQNFNLNVQDLKCLPLQSVLKPEDVVESYEGKSNWAI
jgi:hypothetical protein